MEKKQSSLIEFPCHYMFKVILKNVPNAQDIVVEIVKQTAPLSEQKSQQRNSKKLKYVSISCTAYLHSEEQLTKIYGELKSHSSVMMTL